LYQYDKSVYDKEIAQWHADNDDSPDEIINAVQVAIRNDQVVGEDVADLERNDRMQQSAEYDQGDGWDNLDEDYTDGIYYEEDAEYNEY